MCVLTTPQEWTPPMTSGKKSWKLSRKRITISYLIVPIKDLLVETYKEMLMLWISSQRNMTISCSSNPLLRTLVSMEKELVVFQLSLIIKRKRKLLCPDSNNWQECYTLIHPFMGQELLTLSWEISNWQRNGMMNWRSCQEEWLKWERVLFKSWRIEAILMTGNTLLIKLVCLHSLDSTKIKLTNLETIMPFIWLLMAESPFQDWRLEISTTLLTPSTMSRRTPSSDFDTHSSFYLILVSNIPTIFLSLFQYNLQ